MANRSGPPRRTSAPASIASPRKKTDCSADAGRRRRQPQDRDAAIAALTHSWEDLTGHVPADIYDRLPHALMRNKRPIERKFQACSFETTAMPKDLHEYLHILNEMRKDYVVDQSDVNALAAIVGATFMAPHAMAGAAFGYGFASFNE